MKRLFSLFIASAVIGISAAPADATLTTIGTADYGSGTYNLIHDDDQGLIWLDYTKSASTWQNQMNWAASLNNAGVLTYNIDSAYTLTWGSEGWRLPQVVDTGTSGCNGAYSGTDCGYNVDTATGEMAHLYYDELGNLGYYNASGAYQPGWGLPNTGPFDNLQPYVYWSGAEYALTSNAWYFYFTSGRQDADGKYFNFYALAVRPGDVAAAPSSSSASVPEPGTLMLLGSGLAGLAFWRRFKKD